MVTDVIEAPASIEAEEATLGAILLDPVQFAQVSAILEPQDFFFLRHNLIYAAMVKLFESDTPFDHLTIADELDKRGKLEAVGGQSYLIQLTNNTPTSVYAMVYANIVKRAAVRRQLMDASDQIRMLAQNEEMDLDTVLTDASSVLMKATDVPAFNGTKRMEDVHSAAYDLVNKRVERFRRMGHSNYTTGIPTSLSDLDYLINGLTHGDVHVLGGATGMGKTSAILTMGLKAAQGGHKVTIFSGEMVEETLAIRLQSMVCGIDSQKIQKGFLTEDEVSKWTDSFLRLTDLPMRLIPGGSLHISRMKSIATRLRDQNDLDLLILDGIMQLEGKGEKELRNEIRGLMRGCEEVATSLNIPVLLTHQLSRKISDRANKRPHKEDLIESSAIEQSAAKVMLLYRHGYYEKSKKYQDLFGNVTEVIVDKHRHGPEGVVLVRQDLAQTTFSNLARSTRDSYLQWMKQEGKG